jgi:hypothetical protein
MGLDLVELTLALEDEFGVQIENKDTADLATPGLVADYIFARVYHGKGASCLSQTRFYMLRRALVDGFGIDRKAIRVETQVANLLGSPIRAKWRQLKNSVGSRSFPRLQRHMGFFVLAVIVAPVVLMLTPQFVALWPGPRGFTGGMVLSLLLNIMTYRMGTQIPRNVATVGALAPHVRFDQSQAWSREGVLERVMELTSVELGIPREFIQEQSHFIRDLGAD